MPVVWQEGTTRVLDHGGDPARPVLLVPSLVNRARILDLSGQRSFARWLARQGYRPLLVDWDAPGAVERDFGISDYLARLERISRSLGTEPLNIMGYCMGGLLALALAIRWPQRVRQLVLLATPWDFHQAASAGQRVHLQRVLPWLELQLQLQGQLPVPVLQGMLATFDPLAPFKRYCRFGATERGEWSEEDMHFFAIEDWLADGVPLAAAVAREALRDWYLGNHPGTGKWQVDGQGICPSRLQCPVLLVSPQSDRIVPQAAAFAVRQWQPKADILAPATGHIGMMAGRYAGTETWGPVVRWLGGKGG